MSILKDLPELVSADIISNDTAKQITDFYKRKQVTSPNRQLLIFGILGALLVGIGLIFIIANQWNDLSRTVKALFAFILLIVPQLLCGYVLLKKPDNIVWRESTALLLFFAVGANISLVSQIFNINGDAGSFLLIWMLLTVPLIYILNSSAVSLTYFFCVMIYCFTVRYNTSFPSEEYLCWCLFVLPLPRYYQMFNKSGERLIILHHWMVPFVLTLTLMTLGHGAKMLMHPAYIFLFAIFYFIGNHLISRNRSVIQNGYLVFGSLGTVITLLVMTFKTNWQSLTGENYQFNSLIVAPEFITCVILFSLASILLYRQNKGRHLTDWKVMDIIYILFLLVFVSGNWFTLLPVILTDLLVFLLGLLMLREGTKLSHLGVLNAGMSVIALLVVCRCFDTDLTLFVKGTMCVLVGIGFFAANWLIIKKRKENES
jgi:uncharacterized membrane protein